MVKTVGFLSMYQASNQSVLTFLRIDLMFCTTNSF